MVFSCETRDSRADAKSAVGSRDDDGCTRCAKTPSGMLRDDSVDATQCTCERNDPVTARARVVLPTPAAPTNTTPQQSLPVSADRTAPNSDGRSTICQPCAMALKCNSPSSSFPVNSSGVADLEVTVLGRQVGGTTGFESFHAVHSMPERAGRFVDLLLQPVDGSQRLVFD